MEKIYKLLVDARNKNRKYPSELYQEKNFQQHVAIFEGIKKGNLQDATTAMAHHMRHIRKRLMERTVPQTVSPSE